MARGQRVSTTASPSPASVAWVVLPVAAPSAARSPAARPFIKVFRTTTAVVDPGVMTRSAVNVRYAASSGSTYAHDIKPRFAQKERASRGIGPFPDVDQTVGVPRQRGPRRQSARSVCAGSTVAARRIGNHAASNATALKTTAVIAKMTGSRGET